MEWPPVYSQQEKTTLSSTAARDCIPPGTLMSKGMGPPPSLQEGAHLGFSPVRPVSDLRPVEL